MAEENLERRRVGHADIEEGIDQVAILLVEALGAADSDGMLAHIAVIAMLDQLADELDRHAAAALVGAGRAQDQLLYTLLVLDGDELADAAAMVMADQDGALDAEMVEQRQRVRREPRRREILALR